MLMMLELCSLTCPGFVTQRPADAHDAGALFSYVPWACETRSRSCSSCLGSVLLRALGL